MFRGAKISWVCARADSARIYAALPLIWDGPTSQMHNGTPLLRTIPPPIASRPFASARPPPPATAVVTVISGRYIGLAWAYRCRRRGVFPPMCLTAFFLFSAHASVCFVMHAGCSGICRAGQLGEMSVLVGHFLQSNCMSMIAHGMLFQGGQGPLRIRESLTYNLTS
jgi:hypothetical protein